MNSKTSSYAEPTYSENFQNFHYQQLQWCFQSRKKCTKSDKCSI